jgi:hypothetical protein
MFWKAELSPIRSDERVYGNCNFARYITAPVFIIRGSMTGFVARHIRRVAQIHSPKMFLTRPLRVSPAAKEALI